MKHTIEVSDELFRRAAEIGAAENRSVDEVFASAFEQRILELERLKLKASRGNLADFKRVLSKVPATEPPDHDRT